MLPDWSAKHFVRSGQTPVRLCSERDLPDPTPGSDRKNHRSLTSYFCNRRTPL